MNGVKAVWKNETEEHIPPEMFAKMFVDAMGVVLGICKIYALMWGLLEKKKEMEKKK